MLHFYLALTLGKVDFLACSACNLRSRFLRRWQLVGRFRLRERQQNDVNEKFGPHLLISFRKCIQRFRQPPRGSNDFLNFNLDAHESLRHANLTQPLPIVYIYTKSDQTCR